MGDRRRTRTGEPTDVDVGLRAAVEADVRTTTAADGRRVAYTEYGDPDGVPVVFLHGTPGSRLLGAVYDGPARRADAARTPANGRTRSGGGVRLLAVDRPGYGRSSPWPTRTLRDAGAFVAAVLDDAGVSRAGVVGFSGGGPHALAVAATHEERVRGVDVVSGAVPPSLGSETPKPLRALELLAAASPTLTKGLMRVQSWVAARAPPSAVASQYADDPADLPDGAAALVRRDFVEAFARHRSGFVTETRTLSDAWDVSPADVGAPVRLWHGGRDDNVPVADARRLAARLPDGTLTVFEEADHLRTLLRSRDPILRRYDSGADRRDGASPECVGREDGDVRPPREDGE